MKVRIQLTGISPLLMCSDVGVDPMHPLTKEVKSITDKRKKTDDDYQRKAYLEFVLHMYHDDVAGPYIPGWNITRCIVKAGGLTRHGKNVERGLLLLDEVCPLIYDGPRSIDELWESGEFRDTRNVKVQQARIARTRPIFRKWALDVEAEIDPSQLDLATLSTLSDTAGSHIGLGDFRPRFGRFLAHVEAL